jgi:hypothetical protein
MDATEDTPDIALAKKAIATEVNRTLREKLERLRREYPKLSFNALWERLKAQESDLFTQAKRIEDNDWGTGSGPLKAASASLLKVNLGVELGRR